MKKVNRRAFIQKTAIGGIGMAALPGFSFLSPKDSLGTYNAATDNQYADINVKEMAGLDILRSVTGGIPVSKGAAPDGSRFVLFDKNDKPVPCQNSVLARWPDGSVRWVLLDFKAKPPVNGTDKFRLKWDPKSKDVLPSNPVKTVQGKEVSASSGMVHLTTVPGSLLRISNRFDVKLVLTDRQGKRCDGVVESAKVETNGKLRSTLLLMGSFRTPEKQRVVDFRLRASVYAGLPQFYLEPQILINADNDMIQYINDLSLEFVSLNPIRSASIGGSPGWKGTPVSGAPVRLFQTDDENYQFEGASGKGDKAPGWMEINDGKGTFAVTLRDFWQQWPKSLEVDSKVAKLGLFPNFKEGTFAHMLPWYKHDYLFEGNSYRLREGQTRRWQVWIDLSGNGEALSRSANMSLVAAPDPAQAIATGEWGNVAPSGSKGMSEYDTWADSQFEGYCRSIREQRDYGAMNWGDWWGERGCNWGNHEYDTPLHILTQFVRTGDPKYFYVGEQTARHLSEVDIVHFVNPALKKYFAQWESPAYPSRPGMMHEHSIGHVGGFHPVEKIKQLYITLNIDKSQNPYLCLDPFNLGHIFTLGMAQYYLLSGDPWIKESINRIGENLMKLSEDGIYQFKGRSHVGRESGWTMLALAGEYKINPTDRCLKALRHITDEILSEQNPNCGGWLYSLTWGHCYCVPQGNKNKSMVPHVGEAGFINSVRLNGLSYYYRLTGDDRIPNSVLRGINFLNNDTWNDYISDWRYTSCPATTPIGQIGVTIMAIVNSISLNKDPEQLRILKKAWSAKFARLLKVPKTGPGLGKTYGLTMYGSPEAMNLMVNGSEKEK
jgi:hypothetical protein